MSKGYAFDVGTTLAIGTPDPSPLPEPAEGEIVLRIPDGLTLIGLRDSAVGRELMHRQDWYDKYEWSRTALPAGVYRLRIPIPGSFSKSFAEQQKLLPAGEKAAPVTLEAAALLCLKMARFSDPLNGRCTRSAEPTADGYRVVLSWNDGRLDVYSYRVGLRYCGVGLSSVRTS